MAGAGRRFCAACGQSAALDDAFCRACGDRLTDPSATPVSDAQQDVRPGIGERVGRGIGSSSGYAVRSFAGVATEPVVNTVWKNRPNIPTWQKALGTIAWPVMLLTPHGWIFLGASFFVMVILGDHTPNSWAACVTKWGSIFVIATAAIVLAAVIVIAAVNGGGENSGVILSASVFAGYVGEGALGAHQ